MDAGTLDEFHYAGDEHLAAVADSVYLDFLAHKIFIYEHGLVLIDLNGVLEIFSEHRLVSDYLHRSAAEHEARAHKNRVAYARGNSRTGLDIRNGLAFRVRDAKGFYNGVKRVSVLGALNGVAVGADYLHAAPCKRSRKVDGSLATEGDYNALRLFEMDYIHDILCRQGLEIELVGSGVVGRNGLGVVVDYYRLIAELLNGMDGVDGRIVKLNALSYTDRT